MQVFVAIRPTEPEPEDFCHTVDGELVFLPTDFCDCPDCGCRRSVVGLGSGKATTTFTVADLPHLDRPALVEAFTEGFLRMGLAGDGDRSDVADIVDEHIAMARALPVGGIYRAEHAAP
jgi:hypothetical protein